MNTGQANVELLNQGFFNAQTKINETILNKSKVYPSLWRNKIKRGTFRYGEGYTKKSRQFYNGVPIQDSTRTWDVMQPSRSPNPATGDPGYDACRYDSPVLGYGLEEKQYSIFQTTRRTPDICLTDIVFKWQFEQQLKMVFNSLSDITLGEWENWLRETYVDLSTKLLANSGNTEFTMPMGGDSIDATNIDLGAIGVLDQSMLDRLYMYMYRQSPEGNLGLKNGMPVFGLVTSAETSRDVLVNNNTNRNDWQYANPEFLIEGIGSAVTYKNFAHIMDPMTMRYAPDQANPGFLKRIWPYKQTPTTIGDAVHVDQAYIDAPFEISVIFMNNVFQALVPPANPSNVGGAKFDPADNLGEFRWINIQDRDNNLLGEKGWWFARFRAAPEPLQYSDQASVILHRRCTGVNVAVCNTGTGNTAGNVAILTSANYLVDAALNQQVFITTASSIDNLIGSTVSVILTGGTSAGTYAGVLVDDSGNSTYRVDFGTLVPTGSVSWSAAISSATSATIN